MSRPLAFVVRVRVRVTQGQGQGQGQGLRVRVRARVRVRGRVRVRVRVRVRRFSTSGFISISSRRRGSGDHTPGRSLCDCARRCRRA